MLGSSSYSNPNRQGINPYNPLSYCQRGGNDSSGRSVEEPQIRIIKLPFIDSLTNISSSRYEHLFRRLHCNHIDFLNPRNYESERFKSINSLLEDINHSKDVIISFLETNINGKSSLEDIEYANELFKVIDYPLCISDSFEEWNKFKLNHLYELQLNLYEKNQEGSEAYKLADEILPIYFRFMVNELQALEISDMFISSETNLTGHTIFHIIGKDTELNKELVYEFTFMDSVIEKCKFNRSLNAPLFNMDIVVGKFDDIAEEITTPLRTKELYMDFIRKTKHTYHFDIDKVLEKGDIKEKLSSFVDEVSNLSRIPYELLGHNCLVGTIKLASVFVDDPETKVELLKRATSPEWVKAPYATPYWALTGNAISTTANSLCSGVRRLTGNECYKTIDSLLGLRYDKPRNNYF